MRKGNGGFLGLAIAVFVASIFKKKLVKKDLFFLTFQNVPYSF